MAIVKKGSRRIVVDGVQYRWSIHDKPRHDPPIGDSYLPCSVERAVEQPGAILIITFRIDYDYKRGKNLTPILPSQVANAIRGALEAGWQPLAPGKQFFYDYVPPADQTEDRNE
jgi:hypothetical protein